ncbi:hypothetical protein [Echinicola soli]|uniref:hypothetical protein n=1 Tax=Echinicola soli TaxID=2591634 RepID=UPI00143DDA0B|nr:hypothetical protein [Echinicola soli]
MPIPSMAAQHPGRFEKSISSGNSIPNDLDYKKSLIPVMTAEEYLKSIRSK